MVCRTNYGEFCLRARRLTLTRSSATSFFAHVSLDPAHLSASVPVRVVKASENTNRKYSSEQDRLFLELKGILQ